MLSFLPLAKGAKSAARERERRYLSVLSWTRPTRDIFILFKLVERSIYKFSPKFVCLDGESQSMRIKRLMNGRCGSETGSRVFDKKKLFSTERGNNK